MASVTDLEHASIGGSFGRPSHIKVGDGGFGIGCQYGGNSSHQQGFGSEFLFGYETEEDALAAGEGVAMKKLDRDTAWAVYRAGRLEFEDSYPADPLFIIITEAFKLGKALE